eukprot:4447152-Amphidinium_carterae.1
MLEGRRSTAEQGKLVSRYHSLRGQRGIEATVRKSVDTCPPLVSEEVFRERVACSLVQVQKPEQSSTTLREVCRLRDQYQSSVFLFCSGDIFAWKRIAVAKCQPFVVLWLPLVALDSSVLRT